MSAVPARVDQDRRRRQAWLVWLVFLVAVTVVVAREHEKRSVTANYRGAAERWWAHRDLYGEGIHGFLYLPASAILYTPFASLPGVWGGIAWRWAGGLLLAGGVWRLAALAGQPAGPRFLVMTLLVLPALLGSARNGQMNVLIAGLMTHAAVDLGGARWWQAAASLALAVALKPTALPMALVAAAVCRETSWRIAALLLAFLALPFLTTSPAYAWGQYTSFIEKMRLAGNPPFEGWQDMTGLLRALGHELPLPLMTALRVLAAGATLAASWLAVRRLGRVWGAVTLLAFSAIYILLWNPRTEGVTYVLLGPAVAVFAATALERSPRSPAGWLGVAVAVVLGFANLLTPGKSNTWLRPAVTLVLLGYLLSVVYTGTRDPGGREGSPES